MCRHTRDTCCMTHVYSVDWQYRNKGVRMLSWEYINMTISLEYVKVWLTFGRNVCMQPVLESPSCIHNKQRPHTGMSFCCIHHSSKTSFGTWVSDRYEQGQKSLPPPQSYVHLFHSSFPPDHTECLDGILHHTLGRIWSYIEDNGIALEAMPNPPLP